LAFEFLTGGCAKAPPIPMIEKIKTKNQRIVFPP